MSRIIKFFSIAIAGISLLAVSKESIAQDLNSALKLTYNEQFESADQAFNKLISENPSNGKLYFYSGDNQLASYLLDTVNNSLKEIAPKALAKYNKGISAVPNEPLNYVGIGKIALLDKNIAAAKENFAKAQSFLPVKKEKSLLTKTDQANVLIQIANAYVTIGSRDSALVFGLLRRAESLDPKNPELFLIRGDYWINTFNNGSLAASNYKRSQDFAPESTRARVRLGQLYTQIKSYEDALGYYKDALAIDATFAPAYLEMGFLYAKTKQPVESKKNFKKYLDISTSNIAAKRRYANMLIQTDEYVEAIDQIKQILAMDSVSFNDLNRALAYSYFEEKQYGNAKYYIEKFFKNSPAEKVTSKDYIYRGRILMKNGQDSLGIVNLEKGFQADTTNIDLLNDIANAYTKLKKYEGAAKTYQIKIDLNAGTANDYFKMALAYYNAKLWIESDSALSAVLRKSPDFEPAYTWKARIYSNLDPDSKEGLAKPYYEKLIVKAGADSVKYFKDILEAYNYLGFYYLVNKQYCESLQYWDLIASGDLLKKVGNKVEIGMTKSTIMSILGQPESISKTDTQNGTEELLFYSNYGKTINIDKQGKVNYINTVEITVNENASSALKDLKPRCPEFKSASQKPK